MLDAKHARGRRVNHRANAARFRTLNRRRCGTILCVLTLFNTTGVAASDLYQPWRNGPPRRADFFPLAVWWQAPLLTGHSGAFPTVAAAIAATRINIVLGLGGLPGQDTQWPEKFGGDHGELQSIKANNLYVIGGIAIPHDENASPQSVASVLALARAVGAEANLIGYNAGDEPTCGPPDTMREVPGIIAGIHGFDPTRLVEYNQTAWMIAPPQWSKPDCLREQARALQATDIGSFDLYPLTSPWLPRSGDFPGSAARSDFIAVPNDTLWAQGMATQALIHFGRPDQPAWVYVEAGGDNLGLAGANNILAAGVSAGSPILFNASGWSGFTANWIGLTVSGAGIAAGTRIVSVVDPTHAVISAAAGATAANEPVSVGGGAAADCVAGANLCLVNGNEFRPTAAQVAAEVWMSLISGASGIEYFCDDTLSYSFCLGDQAGGPAAAAAQQNLTHINTTVLQFAPQLNAPTVGLCSMQQLDYATGSQSTTRECHNGVLRMSTDDPRLPGLAMVKQLGGVTYLFAQSDRRSPAGARFTYTLAGLAGKTARVVYDSNARYDPPHSHAGASITLDANGMFTDALGTNQDDYEVRIYAIS